MSGERSDIRPSHTEVPFLVVTYTSTGGPGQSGTSSIVCPASVSPCPAPAWLSVRRRALAVPAAAPPRLCHPTGSIPHCLPFLYVAWPFFFPDTLVNDTYGVLTSQGKWEFLSHPPALHLKGKLYQATIHRMFAFGLDSHGCLSAALQSLLAGRGANSGHRGTP